MNLDVSTQLTGIVVLNVIALALLLLVELRRPGRKSVDGQSPAPPAVDLDRWIDEIEEAEERQTVAARGEFLPRQPSTVNG